MDHIPPRVDHPCSTDRYPRSRCDAKFPPGFPETLVAPIIDQNEAHSVERPHDLWPFYGWGGFCAHVILRVKLETLEFEAFKERTILAQREETQRCRRTSDGDGAEGRQLSWSRTRVQCWPIGTTRPNPKKLWGQLQAGYLQSELVVPLSHKSITSELVC